MLGEMSVKKEVFKPIYRLFPSSLKESFESGELDVKALFLVSDLSYEVLKREGPQRHLPQDRSRDLLRGILSNSYRTVVDELIDAGIIQVRLSELGKESYSTEHHRSKQYSLTKRYRDEFIRDEVAGMLITDHRQLKRIHNFFSRSTENLLKEHDWLKTEIECLIRSHFEIAALKRQGNSTSFEINELEVSETIKAVITTFTAQLTIEVPPPNQPIGWHIVWHLPNSSQA